jgi:hypothetical protein
VSARRDDLIELLAKVKAGVKYETMGHTALCQKAFPKPDNFDGSRKSYAESTAQLAILIWRNGDLNAAKALHDAVLLGDWGFRLVEDACDVFDRDAAPVFHGYCHENPARAWLIAILKALIAVAQPAPHRRENHK